MQTRKINSDPMETTCTTPIFRMVPPGSRFQKMTDQERIERCSEIDCIIMKNWWEIVEKWPNPYCAERREIRRIKSKDYPTQRDSDRLLDLLG